MAKTQTSPFDPLDYLNSSEDVVPFLDEAFETNDPVFVTKAIGIAARE